ncbi:MAG: DUF975 family protein [Oscillospiraceae bacterium]|nr:DUF975 family protein [Oscillospiraceae bacterium]
MYLSGSELKARAKAQLGHSLFGKVWLYDVITVAVQAAVSNVISLVFKNVSYGGLLNSLITGPFSVSVAYMFLNQCRDGQLMNLDDLLKGFREGFGENFLLGLLVSLFTALWSLLLVVPGVIKAYSWSMVYFIRCDHPDYDFRTCMRESAAMMNGNKMRLFLLDLSFIGWLILGTLCIGVGVLWVAAYMEAAHAQFYQNLLDQQYSSAAGGYSY